MNNEQILKKAIEKINKNGMSCELGVGTGKVVKVFKDKRHNYTDKMLPIYEFIFSHDFAKAFWGDGEVPPEEFIALIGLIPNRWQFHLQRMVLEKDPIKYLEKFL